MLNLLLTPLLGLLLAQQVDSPRRAWVSVDRLTVLVEPDDLAFATGRLYRGDPVVIRREGPTGWLAIEPPKGAFSWVEREAIEDLGGGHARVKVRAAAARPGGASARLPAGTWTIVRRGEELRLLGRSPLVLRQPDGERRVWEAIEPPTGELRYIRADGVVGYNAGDLAEGSEIDWPAFEFPDEADPRPERERTRQPITFQSGPIDPSFATVGPPVREVELSPTFAAELARAEAGHRAVLVLPMESWRFDQVRRDYQRLLEIAASPSEQAAAQTRLDQLVRQEAASNAAAQLSTILQRSRDRDAEVRSIHEGLAEFARASDAPFTSKGLLQRSSRMVAGRRVYALIGGEGRVSAYLQIPPGLDAERLLAHRVGVRGDARYDESLRATIIWVRDLEPLDQAP